MEERTADSVPLPRPLLLRALRDPEGARPRACSRRGALHRRHVGLTRVGQFRRLAQARRQAARPRVGAWLQPGAGSARGGMCDETVLLPTPASRAYRGSRRDRCRSSPTRHFSDRGRTPWQALRLALVHPRERITRLVAHHASARSFEHPSNEGLHPPSGYVQLREGGEGSRCSGRPVRRATAQRVRDGYSVTSVSSKSRTVWRTGSGMGTGRRATGSISTSVCLPVTIKAPSSRRTAATS